MVHFTVNGYATVGYDYLCAWFCLTRIEQWRSLSIRNENFASSYVSIFFQKMENPFFNQKKRSTFWKRRWNHINSQNFADAPWHESSHCKLISINIAALHTMLRTTTCHILPCNFNGRIGVHMVPTLFQNMEGTFVVYKKDAPFFEKDMGLYELADLRVSYFSWAVLPRRHSEQYIAILLFDIYPKVSCCYATTLKKSELI